MEQINRDALFCDETEDYRCPSEADAGEVVTFYFRTEKNGADAVVLLEYDPETGALLQEWQMKRLSWECCAGSVGNGADTNRGIDGSGMADKSDSRFDYYSCALTLGTKTFSYVFQVTWGENVCLYNRIGLTEDAAAHPFRLIPGFHVPEWSKGALMYQIYVDRFCNGDPTNDTETNEYIYLKKPVTRVTDWKEPISTLDVGRFYGGDLQGVLDKLDYLKSLKIEAIYLNPVFVSPSNHKYDCQDYDHIDPHYGVILEDADGLVCPEDTDNDRAHKYMTRTADEQNLEASDAFFARLIEEAHKRGIRVLVDGVFNHCGSFNKWLDAELLYQHAGGYPQGAYVSEDSPYRYFFQFHNENAWPFNDSYDGWWGHATLPKLNYEESPELYQYILGIAKKWVSAPFGADGWRLDVVDEYPDELVRMIRQAARAEKPDALIIGEVWEDASCKEAYGEHRQYLMGHELDSVMNYPLRQAILDFLLRGDGAAFRLRLWELLEHYPRPCWDVMMNLLSSHDVPRAITALGGTPMQHRDRDWQRAHNTLTVAQYYRGRQLFMLGPLMTMPLPGMPCLYYGDEAGLVGYADPFNRGPYPWGREDTGLRECIRQMAALRNGNSALSAGELEPLVCAAGMAAWRRRDETGEFIICVNPGEWPLPLPDAAQYGETVFNIGQAGERRLEGQSAVIRRIR